MEGLGAGLVELTQDRSLPAFAAAQNNPRAPSHMLPMPVTFLLHSLLACIVPTNFTIKSLSSGGRMVASHQLALSGAPVPTGTTDATNATESVTLVGTVGISPAACASTLSNWVFLTFDGSRALYWVMNAQVRCKGCSRANCVSLSLSAPNVTSVYGRHDMLLRGCGVCLLLHPPCRVAFCQEKEDARASSSAISAVDFMQPCVLPCCTQTETFFYDTGSNINVTDRGQELGYTMAHSLATVATHNGDDRYEPALFMPSALVLFYSIHPVRAQPHPVVGQTQVDLEACLPTHCTVIGV